MSHPYPCDHGACRDGYDDCSPLGVLAAFLACHADKPDSYEIWGGTERPASPVTLGALRALAA